MNAPRSTDRCQVCGVPAPPGADVCLECGASLSGGSVSCAACEVQNPAHARFCLGCGAPLASVAEADRRVVTVLFADLSGFTQLTEELDPEEVRELVAGCLDRLCECITRWGGFVDKFIGDCVMALFGAPVAYENEEERAVHAALDMHSALETWSVPGGPVADGGRAYRPRLSIGINTGPVVTGVFSGGGAQNYTAIGDTVNVASRLQGLCEAGHILVGPLTYQHTRHLFEFSEERVLPVKGRREPVAAREVLRERKQRGRARGFQDRQTPLVGRSAELDVLSQQWHRARQGKLEVCLLSGPAGIGKSRLTEELIDVEGLDADEIATGRCYPHSSNTPWGPVAELLRELHKQPRELAPADAAVRMIRAEPLAWSPEDVAGLKVALGSPVSQITELEGFSPADRRDLIAGAVGRAIETAVRSPRLLILEDLHWADRTTIEFISEGAGLTLDAPLLIILVARPPLPGETLLASLFDAVSDRLELQPLTPEEARQVIEALLEPHEVPDEFLELVVGRAEGNPLFIEETLKSLVSGGVLAQEAGAWRLQRDLHDLQIPDTIESVLTTRIDALDAPTKRVLQYAAIVGRRFWSGVLTDALARQRVDRELDDLLRGALVRSVPISTVAGDREFLFEHLLLQEVAYDGLLRGVRTELHGAVARWLVDHLRSHAAQSDEWIAFHYERSNEPERALPFLEHAAHAARGRGALQDASSLVERALKLADRPEDNVRLLCIAEDLAGVAGDAERRREAIEELELIADDEDDRRAAAEAAFRRARLLLDSGDLAAAGSTGQRALALFEQLEDISQQGDVLRLLGRISHLWGDYPAALRFYRSSLPLEREAGDRYGQAEIFDRLGLVQVDLGNFTTGLDYFEAARDLCSELGDHATEARVLAHQSIGLRGLGQYEKAEETARAAVDLAERCGAHQAQTGAELSLAQALAARGAIEEAGTLLERVCESAATLGQPGLEAHARLALAQIQTGERARESAGLARELARECGLSGVEVLASTLDAGLDLEAGDLDAAEKASTEALRVLDVHGSIQGPEEAVLHTRARVLGALGREDESLEALQRARTIVENRAGRIEDPELRDHYLNNVALNREILGR